MAPAAGVKLTLALVVVMLPTARPVAAGQGGNGVVKVVVTAGEAWLAAQFVTTLTVYRVPGVRLLNVTGEPVAGWVVAVPLWGVTVTV